MNNKNLHFLVAIILSINLYSQDTIKVYLDENWNETPNGINATYYRKSFRDSNNVWIAHDYYINGQLQMEGSFKSKKINIKHGHFIYYLKNGQKESEGNYINNKADGLWRYWHENGQLKSEGGIFDDKRIGTWNYWNERGKLENMEKFKDGILISAQGYHENGIVYFSGKYVHGKQQGVWTYWNSDGRIILQGKFVDGMKDGKWIRYFKDSQMIVDFKYDIPVNKQLGGIIRRQ